MPHLSSAFDTHVLAHSEQLQYSKKLGRTGLQCTDVVKYQPWKVWLTHVDRQSNPVF